MIRDATLHFAAGELQHGSRIGGQGAVGIVARALLVERPIDRDIGFNVCHFEAGILKLPDFLSESFALLNILHRDIQSAFRGSDRLSGDAESFSREFFHHDDEAPILLAQ